LFIQDFGLLARGVAHCLLWVADFIAPRFLHNAPYDIHEGGGPNVD
jgi:hypothetical protein